jgi:hypothetical protein
MVVVVVVVAVAAGERKNGTFENDKLLWLIRRDTVVMEIYKYVAGLFWEND